MADDGGDAAFDDARIEIPDLEFDKRQRLAFEKEMLGLYVSDHPLMGAEASLRRRTECTITDLEGASRTAPMRVVGGLVTGLAAQVDQEGRPHGRLHARGPAEPRSR